MTNKEIIATIKAEVERRIELHDSLASNAESEMIANLEIGAAQALEDLLPLFSVLGTENPLGLEEEIKRYYDDMDGDCRYAQTARHFAKWGANHTPLPEDTVLFNKGVEEGKRLMMEEAMEGVVCYGSKGAYIETDFLGTDNTDVYGMPGDKVRVIICKKED